jgi:hypothetical protein
MKYLKLFENYNLAPNGNVSNLTPIQYQLVRSNQFKNWFGDWENGLGSKVLDENGEPKVMYHGSSKLFYEFDFNAEKVERTNNFAGFYFTDDEEDAKKYSKNGHIYECFLNVKTPLEHKFGFTKAPSAKAINYVYNKYKNKYNDDYLISKINNLKYSWWVSFMDGSDSAQMAIMDGFDAFFDGAHQICVFYPNNIKLADGSNTTFDKNSNDIRK